MKFDKIFDWIIKEINKDFIKPKVLNLVESAKNSQKKNWINFVLNQFNEFKFQI